MVLTYQIGWSIRCEDIWECLCGAVIDILVTLRHPPPSLPSPPVDQVSLAEGEVGAKQRVLHPFFARYIRLTFGSVAGRVQVNDLSAHILEVLGGLRDM